MSEEECAAAMNECVNHHHHQQHYIGKREKERRVGYSIESVRYFTLLIRETQCVYNFFYLILNASLSISHLVPILLNTSLTQSQLYNSKFVNYREGKRPTYCVVRVYVIK